MAVSSPKWYAGAFLAAFNKEIDFNTDAIKVMLVGSGYTPNQDTHDYKSDVTSEVAGTGYTAGGATMANCVVTYNAATNVLTFDGDDVSWAGATVTFRYIVVYDSTPATDATRPLICYIDAGADVVATAALVSITWDTAGIVSVTVA